FQPKKVNLTFQRESSVISVVFGVCKVMLLVLILILLTIANWFFSELLIVYPLKLIQVLSLYSPWLVWGLLGLFIFWCMGNEE
ncbi:MAG: hypothetical protein SAJ12_13935, partial [Jaaginema sp. PMC 1079.18]|nr:hypothetical protein [Jaaginema sp. PMC 1079.18]